MAKPVSFYSLTIADNTVDQQGNPETSTFQVPITTLTPANVAAQVTLTGTLAAAIAGITLGNFLQSAVTYDRHVIGVGPAASNLAQRENKWLVRYHDTTTFDKYRAEIPTADLSLLPSGSEFLDLTAGAGQTFKDAFEDIVNSGLTSGNTVVVDTVQFIGRNS